ncbi:hypothetical protein U3516DRAFT_773187 [Neocallimastix sp. 'constans']
MYLNSKYYRKNYIINLNRINIGEGNNLNKGLNSLCELTETLDISSLSEDHKNEL